MTNHLKYHSPHVRKHRVQRRGFPLTRPRGRACIFDKQQVQLVERYIAIRSNSPHSDLLKFYLSLYAGLRIGEICGLSVADLLEKNGQISGLVRVRAEIAKGKKARSIPMHPKIRGALEQFLVRHPDVPFVAFSSRYGTPKRQSLTAVTNYMHDLYQRAGLKGFSSHSGRRTFITRLAQKLNGSNFTLRDVQRLAGHAQLNTTECYIEESSNLANLVGKLA